MLQTMSKHCITTCAFAGHVSHGAQTTHHELLCMARLVASWCA